MKEIYLIKWDYCSSCFGTNGYRLKAGFISFTINFLLARPVRYWSGA